VTRPLGERPIACALVLSLAASAAAVAADLQERTRLAYDRYAEVISQKFLERAQGGAPSLPTARDGETIVRPAGEDGIIDVPGGLLHHWIGASFIAGATLEEALKVSYAFDRYHEVYTPIVRSRLLERSGNAYRVLLRIRESTAGLSAVLDVTARVEYSSPRSGNAYSVSTSEDIREIKDAGSPQERQLPAGRDSGYLWRALTLNRIIQLDDGLYVETETLGLSRGFPPLLHWFIEPIARRLGRKSVELSLQEFRSAVRRAKRD
jgi:hypothetical protein